ncbi:MAG: efflux RND transporter permease subunit [Gammaproteobacteria bacterium]|nr:efflux RND transporter permease subunit [Gammaproteobacteria bacterium]
MLSIPIKATSDGVVTIADVTTIRRTFKDAQNSTRANGSPAVAIEVSKRKGVSLVQVVNKVEDIVETEQKHYPSNVIVGHMADQAPDTTEQIETLARQYHDGDAARARRGHCGCWYSIGHSRRAGYPFSFLFAFTVINYPATPITSW